MSWMPELTEAMLFSMRRRVDRAESLNTELLQALKDLMWRFDDPEVQDSDVKQARMAITKAESE